MNTITEQGKVYELREITDIQVYAMSPKVSVAFCTSPYLDRKVSFYVKGNNCVSMDAAGNKFGARYCADGKYYSRSAKPI